MAYATQIYYLLALYRSEVQHGCPPTKIRVSAGVHPFLEAGLPCSLGLLTELSVLLLEDWDPHFLAGCQLFLASPRLYRPPVLFCSWPLSSIFKTNKVYEIPLTLWIPLFFFSSLWPTLLLPLLLLKIHEIRLDSPRQFQDNLLKVLNITSMTFLLS